MGGDVTCQVGKYLAHSVADSAVIRADSELGDFVVKNLQSPMADMAWRGDKQTRIEVDLPSIALIDTIALCIHNLSSGATVCVSAYDNAARTRTSYGFAKAQGTALYGFDLEGWNETGFNLPSEVLQSEKICSLVGLSDEGFNQDDGFNLTGWNGVNPGERPDYSVWLLELDQVVETQYLTIDINDPDNPDDYLEIRRLKVGVMIKPSSNFEWGYQFGFISGERHRAGTAQWSSNKQEELAQMNELILSHSADKGKLARTRSGELIGFPDDIVWLGWPDAAGLLKAQHTALVALIDASIPHQPNEAQSVTNMKLEEIYYDS